jgi:hypothetical protein
MDRSPGIGWPVRRAAQATWARPQLDAVAPALFTALAVVLIVRDQGGYFPTSWGWSTLIFLGVVCTWLLASGRTDAGRLEVCFYAALLLLTAWVGLSALWSVNPAQSVLELERWLMLLAGSGAFLLLVSRRTFTAAMTALLVAITSIGGFSLTTRLLPTQGRFDPHDPIADYRLFEPAGYWNGLGAFCALGILVALGLVAEPRARAPIRILGALALNLLPLVLFFTFSRGAWLALAAGVLLLLAASPQRLHLACVGAVFAIAPAVGIAFAWRSSALTDQDATLSAASHQGHRLAVVVALLSLGSISLVPAVTWAERRVSIGPLARRAVGLALVLCVASALAVVLEREGGPVKVATRTYRTFAAPVPPPESADLNSRLFNLNGNGRAQLWSVAMLSFESHWLTGTGAGSFERNWDRSPKANQVVRDAHGLYVETLSELGAVGLLLLVAVLGCPLVAAARARSEPYVPALAAAYAVFLLHNAIDWDWELGGVALTGLFVGCLLLVARREGREREVPMPVRTVAGGAAVAAAGFALVAAIGNGALAAAQTANREHRYAAAESNAAEARRWMPWSPEPLKALGTAQFKHGEVHAAQASFRKAVSIDAADWQGWLDLAATVRDSARAQAVRRARELYPTSPEVVEFLAAVRASDRS